MLDEFRRWLAEQPAHHLHRNYVWSALILDELFPDRRRASVVPIEGSPPRADGWEWPRPAPRPISEDDLVYPEEDALAIEHLFRRLREFLNSRHIGKAQT